jgi:putative membrane protein insertion efficiency factor
MKYVLIGFVKAWRWLISPLYGDVCKFYPTCSAYGLKALQVHGAVKGAWLILRRLVRCHPWSLGGYDPVPGTPEAAAWAAEQAGDLGAAELIEGVGDPGPGCAHQGHGAGVAHGERV